MPRVLALVAGTSALAFCFHQCVLAYAEDHYYQSHFVFLWAFFFAALYKAGRGRVGHRLIGGVRSTAGICVGLLALGVLHVGLLTGSSTAQRFALVLTFAAWALLAARGWSARRCLGYAAFATLCFGVPYSAYFQLTDAFRRSFVSLLEVAPAFLPLDYHVEGMALQFRHYRLDITPDCSGFNQMVTFLGLAFLGSLTGDSSRGRVLGLFAVGIALAYLSNLARLLVFATFVAFGQYRVVENPDLHAAMGFAAYAPFILLFIHLILRTHRPLPFLSPARDGRGIPLVALLLPFVLLRVAHVAEPEVDRTPPEFMAGLSEPPGYELAQRAESEQHERDTYATPWLLNASFADPESSEHFELFAYLTRSRSHLAVHQVSNCLECDGAEVRYGPPVEVGGRTFWTLELRDEGATRHGYFAFWVDGRDMNDRLGTQLEVMGRRLSGLREVGLTRFLMPGPLTFPISARDRELLEWRAGQLRDLAPRSPASPQ